MTQEKIIEGNRLIAEFDGWKFHEREPHEESCWTNSGTSWVDIEPPEFNNSWELLLAVIQKIEKDIYLKGDTESILLEILMGIPITTDINEAWKRVVQFLQWYNQNK